MRYALMVVFVTAWAALCVSQGLSINGGLGQAAIFLIPTAVVGWALSPGRETL